MFHGLQGWPLWGPAGQLALQGEDLERATPEIIQTITRTPVGAIAQYSLAKTYVERFPITASCNPRGNTIATIEFRKVFTDYPRTQIAYDALWSITDLASDTGSLEEKASALLEYVTLAPPPEWRLMLAYDRTGTILGGLGRFAEIDNLAYALAAKYSANDYAAESRNRLGNRIARWANPLWTYALEGGTPAQQQVIRNAVKEWSDATGGVLQFVFEPGGAERTVKGGPGVDIFIKVVAGFGGVTITQSDCCKTPETVGEDFVELVLSTIFLGEGQADESLRLTALHEFGHALGLQHSLNRQDLLSQGSLGTMLRWTPKLDRWLRESPAPKIGRKQGAGHEANT